MHAGPVPWLHDDRPLTGPAAAFAGATEQRRLAGGKGADEALDKVLVCNLPGAVLSCRPRSTESSSAQLHTEPRTASCIGGPAHDLLTGVGALVLCDDVLLAYHHPQMGFKALASAHVAVNCRPATGKSTGQGSARDSQSHDPPPASLRKPGSGGGHAPPGFWL